MAPWSNVSQKWGHPAHSICSYLGTFPPILVRYLIESFTDPGDLVVDPFSGRGTTLLEARIARRRAYGSDLNPISIALSRANSFQATTERCLQRLAALEKSFDMSLYLTPAIYESEQIKLLFHPKTLAQLIYLSKKISTSESAEDAVLLGALLGVLHGGERKDGSSAYASIAMPNTFSMSPGYVRKYVSEKHLEQKERNVFDLVRDKVKKLAPDSLHSLPEAVVATCDAKSLSQCEKFRIKSEKPALIVGSPPYLNIVNYAKQNWIRMWLLRREVPEVHGLLDDNHSMSAWLDFMERSIDEFKSVLRPDGVIALVIGDVVRGGNVACPARELIRRLVQKEAFGFFGCISDDLDVREKVTRIWKKTKGKATAVDRVVVLSDERPAINSDWLSKIEVKGLAQAPMSADEMVDEAERLVGFSIRAHMRGSEIINF